MLAVKQIRASRRNTAGFVFKPSPRQHTVAQYQRSDIVLETKLHDKTEHRKY